MNKIKYVEADLFTRLSLDNSPGTIIIPHVVNTKGKFAAGFVNALKKQFPRAESEYRKWYNREYGDCLNVPEFKLGKTQFVGVYSDMIPRVIVANMLAQTLGGPRPLYYQHLASCMCDVAKFINSELPRATCPLRIHAPMFGSGLAGGKWEIIAELIHDCWLRDMENDIDVTVYYLPGQAPPRLANSR